MNTHLLIIQIISLISANSKQWRHLLSNDIDISVVQLDGSIYPTTVNGGGTVEDMTLKISQNTAIPKDAFALTFGGQPLSDVTQLLSNLGIGSEQRVYMIPSISGTLTVNLRALYPEWAGYDLYTVDSYEYSDGFEEFQKPFGYDGPANFKNHLMFMGKLRETAEGLFPKERGWEVNVEEEEYAKIYKISLMLNK